MLNSFNPLSRLPMGRILEVLGRREKKKKAEKHKYPHEQAYWYRKLPENENSPQSAGTCMQKVQRCCLDVQISGF